MALIDGRIPPCINYCSSLLYDIAADIDYHSSRCQSFRGLGNVLVLREPIRVQEITYSVLVVARTDGSPATSTLSQTIITKLVYCNDYTINVSQCFYALDELWDPHTRDRFASHYNVKRQKFNTMYYQPGSSGVIAFAQDWSNDNNWLCPPVCLICKVVIHKVCKPVGILIVPLWKSAHLWPVICSDGLH